MKPPRVHYGSWIPFGFGAMALPGHIFLRATREEAAEMPEAYAVMVAHERVHCHQQRSWLHFPLYLLRYFLWKPFRFRVEIEAFGRVNLAAYEAPEKVSRPMALWILSEYSRLGGFGSPPTAVQIEADLLRYCALTLEQETRSR